MADDVPAEDPDLETEVEDRARRSHRLGPYRFRSWDSVDEAQKAYYRRIARLDVLARRERRDDG